MNGKTLILTAALVCATVACAKEWHVYSTEVDGATGCQQLTNAFAQAKSGDTITIHSEQCVVTQWNVTARNDDVKRVAIGARTCPDISDSTPAATPAAGNGGTGGTGGTGGQA